MTSVVGGEGGPPEDITTGPGYQCRKREAIFSSDLSGVCGVTSGASAMTSRRLGTPQLVSPSLPPEQTSDFKDTGAVQP